MNFQSLFKEYTPVEYGDFFRLYRINNRGYLIYCNENNVICCMELYGFTDISVIMLAELLKVNLEELEDCEEFSLPVRCSRQQIIDYLFDVSAKETYVKLKHVSGLHGYLLKSIHQDKSGLNAYRNLFQFDPVKGNTRLLFDDNQCLASIRTDKSGSVYICWDPVLFFGLDKSGDPDSTGYLLSSSSTLLKVDTSGQPSKYLDDCLQQFKFARKYQQYKEERNLVDFDDLLILTYFHASQHQDRLKKYSWIQIDEVQDLSPFQFGIIDLFTDHSKENVTLYLGDEKQAIFSFIGAKLATLEWLRERCGENMHRLYFNYRSPKYLLDVFNTYANMELDVDPHFLPKTNNLTEAGRDSLCIMAAPEKDAEVRLVAESVGNFCTSHPDERVAVFVPWNMDADHISHELSGRNIPHFKISGTDLFTTRQAQLLFAHLQVVYLDSNMMAWSKILTGTGIFNEDAEARRFVKNLRDNYLLPSDFLNYTRSSYMLELCRCCQGEYVIFDTETTGLNVFEDDIVQIAAIKVNAGKITDRFNIILHTEKPIPAMLGGIVNPLLQEYERAEKVDRKTGLCAFMDFVGDCTLIGQNVEYDCNILDYNLRRDCGDFSFFTVHPLYFDTLRVARIMAPRLKSYKLKSLLEVFGLEGENSHLADDDVIATLSVLDHFLGIFAANMQQHIDCLQYNSAVAELFRRAYADIYHGTLSRLYQRSSEYPLLVDGLEHLYDTFIQKGWIEANPKMQYIFSFLRNDVISPEKTPSLKEQLSAHLLDITTYREADLCDSSCITEKVFVSTVHKAKGLEFENVIIFEATDGVYPFFDKKTPEEIRESARLFYVAMTRAKIRLHITYAESVSGISKWGNPYSIDKEPTPFLRHIKKFFHLYSM